MTLRMYLHKPKVVMVAQVDLGGNAAAYPQMTIGYKNVTVGSIAACRDGMTLLLGSAPGKDDYGRLRYKHPGTGAGTSMTVSRFSQGSNDGEGYLVENSYITVLEEYRVWAKIPRMIGSVVYKDGEVWASVNAKYPPPVANAGAGVAGTIAANGKLTVRFLMGNSFKWDASVGAAGGYNSQLTNWLWEVGDGTITVGTTTSQSITVEFPAGFRYVYLKAYGETYPPPDAAVPNIHVQSVPVFARDPAADLSTTAFHIVGHQQNFVGQEITAEFFTPLSRDDFPDGGLMMLWDDAIAFSDPADRYHMQFVGWHQADSAAVRADETATLHSTRLTFVDVGRRLQLLPGFSQVLEYNANPNLWSHTRFPSMFYYFWYILFWHSTALEVAELRRESIVPLHMEFVVLGSDRANLHEQCESIATKVTPDHHFTCSKWGILHVVADPLIQPVGERTTSDLDTWTDDDWSDIQYGYQRPPKVQQIRTMAIIAGKNYVIVDGNPTITVVASRAPGEGQGQGEQYLEIGERITLSQSQLNISEGHRYARLNARYGRFNITLPWERVDERYDLSRLQWVKLTIVAANHPERELPASFTLQRGICHEMTIQYDYGVSGLTRSASFQWEMETSGTPAETEVLWPDVPDPALLAARANTIVASPDGGHASLTAQGSPAGGLAEINDA